MIQYDYFPDLTPCVCYDAENLVAVGWLDPYHEFATGDVPAPFLDKLRQLLPSGWHPFPYSAGQDCGLCDGVYRNQSLFVPAGNGFMVAPELIDHYIVCHGYQPPAEFQAAVLACPPMLSDEYFDELELRGYKVAQPERIYLRRRRALGFPPELYQPD